jgi:hypothetical protein
MSFYPSSVIARSGATKQSILYNNKNSIVNNKQNNLFLLHAWIFFVISLDCFVAPLLAMTEYGKIALPRFALPSVLAMTEKNVEIVEN